MPRSGHSSKSHRRAKRDIAKSAAPEGGIPSPSEARGVGSEATGEGGPTEGARKPPSEATTSQYVLTPQQQNSWSEQTMIITSEASVLARKSKCEIRKPLARYASLKGEASSMLADCMRGTCDHCKPLRAAKIAIEELRGFLALDEEVFLEKTTKREAAQKVNYHGSKLGKGAVAFDTDVDLDSPSTLVTTYRSPRASVRERQIPVPLQELGMVLYRLALNVPSAHRGDPHTRITPNSVLRKAILDTEPPKKPSRWRFMTRAAKSLVKAVGEVSGHITDGLTRIIFQDKLHAQQFNGLLRNPSPPQNPLPRLEYR